MKKILRTIEPTGRIHRPDYFLFGKSNALMTPGSKVYLLPDTPAGRRVINLERWTAFVLLLGVLCLLVATALLVLHPSWIPTHIDPIPGMQLDTSAVVLGLAIMSAALGIGMVITHLTRISTSRTRCSGLASLDALQWPLDQLPDPVAGHDAFGFLADAARAEVFALAVAIVEKRVHRYRPRDMRFTAPRKKTETLRRSNYEHAVINQLLR